MSGEPVSRAVAGTQAVITPWASMFQSSTASMPAGAGRSVHSGLAATVSRAGRAAVLCPSVARRTSTVEEVGRPGDGRCRARRLDHHVHDAARPADDQGHLHGVEVAIPAVPRPPRASARAAERSSSAATSSSGPEYDQAGRLRVRAGLRFDPKAFRGGPQQAGDPRSGRRSPP